MKPSQLIFVLAVNITLLAFLHQSALAQCYNAAGAPVACPGEKEKKKRSAATPLPTPIPTVSSNNAILPLPSGAGDQPGEAGSPVGNIQNPGGSPSGGPPVVQPWYFGGLALLLAGGYVVVDRVRRRRSVLAGGTTQHELGHDLGHSHDSDADSLPASWETGQPNPYGTSTPGVGVDLSSDGDMSFKQTVENDDLGQPRGDGDDDPYSDSNARVKVNFHWDRQGNPGHPNPGDPSPDASQQAGLADSNAAGESSMPDDPGVAPGPL